MFDLAVWIVFGLIGGIAVGAYKCGDSVWRAPKCGSSWYCMFCGAIGGALGALIFYSYFHVQHPDFVSPV
jgi:hypothetical protein